MTRKDEIIQLWHIARTAGFDSRFDRMQYVKREYLKNHPNEAGKALWHDIDEFTRPSNPVSLGASSKPDHHATVLP